MAYHRKKGSGGRDLGLSSNGKGSANRVSDNKAFADNFDAIDWGHGKETLERLDGSPSRPGDVVIRVEKPFVTVTVQPLSSEKTPTTR